MLDVRCASFGGQVIEKVIIIMVPHVGGEHRMPLALIVEPVLEVRCEGFIADLGKVGSSGIFCGGGFCSGILSTCNLMRKTGGSKSSRCEGGQK